MADLPRLSEPQQRALHSALQRPLQALRERLSPAQGSLPLLDQLRADPTATMRLAGLEPDPWQERMLRSTTDRILTLTTRQAGKSQTVAGVALNTALLTPKSLVLLLSPSERQSGELMAKAFAYYDTLGKPVPTRKRTELQLHLTNGSRIIALPESERTIRGYSGVRLLIVDEASRVDDALFASVRPMLSVSRGRLIALTTPFGKRGWFYEAWVDEAQRWERVRVPATECPRISPQFLADEQRSLGERWYRQEYLCSYEDAIDAVFSDTDIYAAMSGDVRPLF